MMKLHTALLAACASVGAVAAAPAVAEDFYKDKTITFLVGSNPGGGYDTYARAIARQLPKYIPGSPQIVVRNQPGAGSGTAAAAIFNTAPKDGTWIGAVFPGVIMGPILDEKWQAHYDPSKFVYLGSADSSTRVCITYETSKVKTFEDARKMKAIMGASAAGGSTRDYAYMLNHVAGAKFEVVSGYKGSVDIFLAMERGEVDGMCGLDLSSLRAQRPSWLQEKKVNVLVQTALEPEPDLVKMGVPEMWKFISDETDRKAASLIVSQQVFGRPYIAPPGVPDEASKILRSAFVKAMNDKELREEAAKARIDVTPSSGDAVQKLVAEVYETPKATIDRAKRIIQP